MIRLWESFPATTVIQTYNGWNKTDIRDWYTTQKMRWHHMLMWKTSRRKTIGVHKLRIWSVWRRGILQWQTRRQQPRALYLRRPTVTTDTTSCISLSLTLSLSHALYKVTSSSQQELTNTIIFSLIIYTHITFKLFTSIGSTSAFEQIY